MNTQTIYLHHSWKFHYGEEPDAWKKDYDDTGWTAVELPHDWSVAMPFSRSYSSGTGYAAGGIGWYRGTFSLPEKYRGKRIVLLFDGVYKESQVWFNSYYHGFHPNGYTPFFYDITSQAVFGTDGINEISVRVDRTEISDSRWFTGSGITRKVTLLVTDLLHVTPYGTCFSINRADKISADLSITTEICNMEDQETSFSLVQYLRDQNGNTVFFAEQRATLLPGETAKLKTEGTVAQPTLWSPKHPSLYTLETWLHKAKDDSAFLADKFRVGIRTFRFDADYGFFLNEIPMKIKGVCVHHDAGALGAAVTKEIWIRRLEKLKEMGCNAIRMSHNPHMPELYDLCDEMGFLVMDEAFDEWEGCKNKWFNGHNVYPPKHQGYSEDFPEWHERDLTSLVRRDRNHPCVVMWSIGNEIDYPNDPYNHPSFQVMTGNNDANKPEEERKYNAGRPNMERLTVISRELAGIVKKSDRTRPVTAAVAFPELSAELGYIDHLDVVGYNYKEHLYEEHHKRWPDKPFTGSENGQQYDAWKSVMKYPYISGQFLWIGIDYLGECAGWPVHSFTSGNLTTAGFEKPRYYSRQSWWSDDKVLHICTGRKEEGEGEWKEVSDSWNYLPGEEIEVRCYTNCQNPKLYVNGKEVADTQKVDSSELGYDTWIVPFKAGKIEAVAENVHHVLETVNAPVQIQLEEAGCEDIVQIELTVLDDMGRRVISDQSEIHVAIEGDCEYLGMDNGDATDVTEYRSHYRHCLEGKMMIYLRKLSDEKVKVTASNPKLRKAQIEV